MKRETTKTGNGVVKAGKMFLLRKSFAGKQIEISLKTDSKALAKTLASRFIATARENGVEAAITELRGKQVLKKGDDPTFDQMETLYREFCRQSANPPRATTINHNVGCLRRMMEGFPTVGAIVHSKLIASHRGETPSEKRSFASEVGNASAIFKKSALRFYHARGIKLANPFMGMEIQRPKVEAYTPLSTEQRTAIWDGIESLPAVESMIVFLALTAGLRRSEIEAARVAWFTVHNDCVFISIQESGDYVPKSGEKRLVPLCAADFSALQAMRERAVVEASENEETRDNLRASPFFVPVIQRKGSGGRLWGRFRAVTTWLKSHGISAQKPLHALRKEFGSLVASDPDLGIYHASRLLGHSDVRVTQTHYASLIATPNLDLGRMIERSLKR